MDLPIPDLHVSQSLELLVQVEHVWHKKSH